MSMIVPVAMYVAMPPRHDPGGPRTLYLVQEDYDGAFWNYSDYTWTGEPDLDNIGQWVKRCYVELSRKARQGT